MKCFFACAVLSVAAVLPACVFVRPPPPKPADPNDPLFTGSERPMQRGRAEEIKEARERKLTEPQGLQTAETTDTPVFYGNNAVPAEEQVHPGKAPGLVPTTIEIRSACTEPVDVFYGEEPALGRGRVSRISPGSMENASRKPDGSIAVWILDTKKSGVAVARATSGSKRVTIEKSCTSLRVD